MADIKEKLNESATGQPDPVALPASAQNGTVANATLKPGACPAGEQGQMTRSEAMAQVMATMGGVEMGDLSKFLEGLSMNSGPNQSKSIGDDVEKNRASITAKGVAKDAMKEDVIAAFKGQELSEETLNTMTTIFESQVHARVEVIRAEITEEAEKQVEEAINEGKEEMSARVDEYMTYLAEEWMESNKLSVENNLRTEITEEFITDLKSIFEKHNITVPEEKVDVVEEMATELADLKAKLDEQIKLNIENSKKLAVDERKDVVEAVTTGLSANQKIELMKHIESVDATLPLEEYKGKLMVLKEHYCAPKGTKTTGVVLNESEAKTLEELATDENIEVKASTPEVQAVIDALSKTVTVKNH